MLRSRWNLTGPASARFLRAKPVSLFWLRLELSFELLPLVKHYDFIPDFSNLPVIQTNLIFPRRNEIRIWLEDVLCVVQMGWHWNDTGMTLELFKWEYLEISSLQMNNSFGDQS